MSFALYGASLSHIVPHLVRYLNSIPIILTLKKTIETPVKEGGTPQKRQDV